MEELERKRHEENAALDKKREQDILLLEAEYKEQDECRAVLADKFMWLAFEA